MNKSIFEVLCTAIYAMTFWGCSQKDGSELLYINDDKYTTVSLEDFATEVKVSRIKSDILLDNIDDHCCFGDNVFLLSQYRKVYYMKDDSIVSEINRQGRGPGEYYSIFDLTYSPKDSILYAFDMQMSAIHGYKVPSFEFVKRYEIDYQDLQCMRYYDNQLIYISWNKILSLSLDNDSTTKLLDINPINIIMAGNSSFYLSPNDELYLAIQDSNTNICKYDGKRFNKVFSFNYGKNGIPDDFKTKEHFDEGKFYSFISKNDYSVGCFYPRINESGISFWHFKKKGVMQGHMYTIYDGNRYKNYKVEIPGININIIPNYVIGDWYVSLIQGTKETLLEANEPLSPLGKKIIKAIDAQKDGNPILLYYKLPTKINK